MADQSHLRPVGGYCVRQRAPGPHDAARWKPAMFHQTLDAAFTEAERVAKLTGASYSILHEVGCVEPKLAPAPEPAPTAAGVLADLQWGALADCADGGTEPACPYCGEPQRLGHAPRCRLATALRGGA